MARLAAACVVLLALAGCGKAPQDAAVKEGLPRLTPAVANALDARLRKMVQATGVPGASAAVVFADGREWTGAAGDAVVRPRRPMTTGTALPFDSVTKMVTAATAMRLVEQHRLSLDDPIRRWYPAWRGDPAATVRDLLGHTSGIGEPPDALVEKVLAHPRFVVSAREAVAAAGKPGPRTKEAEYSNTGFVLAGIIIERAAGEPVATLARRQLLDHPGGDGLALQPAERPATPRAHSYWYPQGLNKRVDADDGGPLIPRRNWAILIGTAGALAGDVPSLARWGHQLLGGHVLEPSSLHAMTRFHFGAFWDGYGLGLAKFSIDDHLMWGHTGDGLGSHTELWHLPKERVTIAISWNDAAIDSDAQILPALVRAALGD